MKTNFGTLAAVMAGVVTALGCTPVADDSEASVPMGSYKAAACSAIGNEVVLVVDTSERMGEPSGFKQGSKYLMRKDLVVDALKRNLPHLKKAIDFGLETFPFVDHRDAEGRDRICPGSCEVGEVEVHPGDPYGWIVSRLEHIDVGGKAAVAKALLKVRDFYRDHPADGRTRAAVLFVGGGDQCDGDVMAAIEALRAIEVATYVVSFENAPDQALLEEAARRGVPASRANPGRVHYLRPDTGIEMVEDAISVPELREACNGIDDDCDGLTDETFDADGDGWASCNGDCDDNDPTTYPGAEEGGRAAPYMAARVRTWFQGGTKAGATVPAVASNPAEALDFNLDGGSEVAFSLGFDGFVEVEFDCPLKNGAGPDLRVYEKTAAGGSTETADVYAWDAQARTWVKLGQASNLPEGDRPNVKTDFELGSLAIATRIRIVNTTSSGAAAADGFDVNGVLALHECGDCDGRDNDCDGQADEFYGVGDVCFGAQGACQIPGEIACQAAGMKSACVFTALPLGDEICNGLDDDCDGKVDEDLARACASDCGTGHQACVDGAWAPCQIDRPNPELCNDMDDNCDGRIDEGFDVGEACTWGKAACAVSGEKACTADGLETECVVSGGLPSGEGDVETCNGIDDDCDGVADNGKGLCPGGQVCFKGTCVYD